MERDSAGARIVASTTVIEGWEQYWSRQEQIKAMGQAYINSI